MKKIKLILLLTITFLLLSTLVKAQSNKYQGYPENDADFVVFITKNLGKVVTLNLTLSEDAMISGGYKGVQPMFDGAKLKGISYSFFNVKEVLIIVKPGSINVLTRNGMKLLENCQENLKLHELSKPK